MARNRSPPLPLLLCLSCKSEAPSTLACARLINQVDAVQELPLYLFIYFNIEEKPHLVFFFKMCDILGNLSEKKQLRIYVPFINVQGPNKFFFFVFL